MFKLFCLAGVGAVVCLLLHYAFYNRNMSPFMNLYAAFIYYAMIILMGKGSEEDKDKFIRKRRMITINETKIPKSTQEMDYTVVGDGVVVDVTHVKTRDGTFIDLYTYTPSIIEKEGKSEPFPLVYFTHGGGWCFSNRWAEDTILCDYALKARCVLTYVNYRLAPEYKHPTAINDCYDCLLFLLKHSEEYHIQKNNVTLMGDSAGGMICCGLIEYYLRDHTQSIFKKNVLLYPAMDSRVIPADDPYADERQMIYSNTLSLSALTLKIMAEWYFHSPEEANTVLASPILREDYTNYPPTVIITCEYDTLKIAARVSYERMKKSGVPVKYINIKRAIHGIWGSTLYDAGINEIVLKELL